MSTPHKALSALICIVVAFVLGVVARLPTLMERLESQVHKARYEVNLSDFNSGGSAWGSADSLSVR